MQAQSRKISSNQSHLHPGLATAVRRHLATQSRKPVAPHNMAAFELLLQELAARPRPLVLDSFCGTGHSTFALARRHPQHLVIGIDKSAHRLSRHPGTPGGNYLLLQAECEDLWRLMAEHGIHADYHYLLYPNPWPKAKHLQRRVHASAGFAWLLRLGTGAGPGRAGLGRASPGRASPGRASPGRASPGRASPGRASPGRVELRSNWQTYVEEFGVAMHLAGCAGSVCRVLPDPALSLFEDKYDKSGHDLWAFRGNLSGLALPAIAPPAHRPTVTRTPI